MSSLFGGNGNGSGLFGNHGPRDKNKTSPDGGVADVKSRNQNVAKEIKLVGQPKIVRKHRSMNIRRGAGTLGRRVQDRLSGIMHEIRTQFVMTIPSITFRSESEMTYFFEEAVASEICDLHLETVKLETIGRVGGFIADPCTGIKIIMQNNSPFY